MNINLIRKKTKKTMVRLWLTNIDDNSPKHPYLFATKPFWNYLYSKVMIKLMTTTLETTCAHCISWCCLFNEKEINILRLQSSQNTKCCFWGGKNMGCTFWYKFWTTSESFCISKNLVCCIICCEDYVYVTFQFYW